MVEREFDGSTLIAGSMRNTEGQVQSFWSNPNCQNASDSAVIWTLVWPQYSYSAEPGCFFTSIHSLAVIGWVALFAIIVGVFSFCACCERSERHESNPVARGGVSFLVFSAVLWCTAYLVFTVNVGKESSPRVCLPAIRDAFNVVVADTRLDYTHGRLVVSYDKISKLGPVTVERMLRTCPGIWRSNRDQILVEMDMSDGMRAIVLQRAEAISGAVANWMYLFLASCLIVIPQQSTVDGFWTCYHDPKALFEIGGWLVCVAFATLIQHPVHLFFTLLSCFMIVFHCAHLARDRSRPTPPSASPNEKH